MLTITPIAATKVKELLAGWKQWNAEQVEPLWKPARMP